jgi:hypothetical protein
MKKLILAIALSCPVLLTSCAGGNPQTASVPPGPDATLTKVSIYLLDIAKANGSVQSSIISANQQKLMSDANFTKVAAICTRINTFVAQASAITRAQVNLAPAQRTQIANLLNPIISAFTADMNNGLIGITDPNTKTTVSAALLLVQTGLSNLQLIVGSN